GGQQRHRAAGHYLDIVGVRVYRENSFFHSFGKATRGRNASATEESIRYPDIYESAAFFSRSHALRRQGRYGQYRRDRLARTRLSRARSRGHAGAGQALLRRDGYGRSRAIRAA